MMRARTKPTGMPLPRVDELHAQALASAQAVTARAITYSQQHAAAATATKGEPPAPAADAAVANAMTAEVFARLRDHSQRLVERLQATERQIAARYDRVARSLVAKTTGR